MAVNIFSFVAAAAKYAEPIKQAASRKQVVRAEQSAQYIEGLRRQWIDAGLLDAIGLNFSLDTNAEDWIRGLTGGMTAAHLCLLMRSKHEDAQRMKELSHCVQVLSESVHDLDSFVTLPLLQLANHGHTISDAVFREIEPIHLLAGLDALDKYQRLKISMATEKLH